MSIYDKKYHFVYKTIHRDGYFYIGRHSTDTLNDGYLGSGLWVNRASKDKLRKQILSFASSFDELVKLEENFISKYYDDPLCMNMKRASVGWTPQDAKEAVTKQIETGKNALCNGRKIKRNIISQDAGNKGREAVKKMFEAGTHPLGGDLARERIKLQIEKNSHPGTRSFQKYTLAPTVTKLVREWLCTNITLKIVKTQKNSSYSDIIWYIV